MLLLSVWLSFWLRLAHPLHSSFQAAGLWLLLAVLLVGLPLYALTGQYKGLTRYVGSRALYRLAGRNVLLVLLLACTGVMFRLPMPPIPFQRSVLRLANGLSRGTSKPLKSTTLRVTTVS